MATLTENQKDVLRLAKFARQKETELNNALKTLKENLIKEFESLVGQTITVRYKTTDTALLENGITEVEFHGILTGFSTNGFLCMKNDQLRHATQIRPMNIVYINLY